MKIGTIKEIKDNENRVALTPQGAAELVKQGAEVFAQKGCGSGAGFSDEMYLAAGVKILDTAQEVVKEVDLLLKVKEPVPSEYSLLALMKGKALFTYLHLSGVYPELTTKLLEYEITAIAYETVEDENGQLPLLAPMSQVAGVLSVQYGAQYLQKKYLGVGVSLGKINGADPAETVVVGAGFVGATAARTAAGMGGHVTVLNRGKERLAQVQNEFREDLGEVLFKNVSFLELNDEYLRANVAKADLLIGAVLIPGARAPIVVTQEMVATMKKGAVVIDVSIDQGGCIWGSKPTTHTNPIYVLEDKVYCCITNMPGQVARQSTQALTHATFPYIKLMLEQGIEGALKSDLHFGRGLNTFKGKITYKKVAEDLGMAEKYEEMKF
jgi:alanine dehydrogenase